MMNRLKLGAVVALVFIILLTAALWLNRTQQVTAEIEPPIERTYLINRTKTIGDVTVTLSEIKDKGGALGVEYSYAVDGTGREARDVLAFGSPEITRANGAVARTLGTSLVDDTTEIAHFDLTSRAPGSDEALDVQLGWYVVPKPDISGKAVIQIGPEYASAIRSGENPIEIPVQSQLLVEDGVYQVTSLFMHRGRGFTFVVIPLNDDAKNISLASVVEPGEITLTDNLGNSYFLIGTGTNPAESAGSIIIESQQLDFQGEIAMEASTLTLNIKGGAELVGPFVFENIALVSEDAPPPAPDLPDDPDPGDGTPVNVNN